jgi:hypothetical protein
LRLIHAAAKRQRQAPRSPPTGNGSVGDAALAAALDHVLDPVESLREETFQSEAIQAPHTDAEVARPKDSREHPSLRLLILRLRFSSRAPYCQIRQAFFWGLVWIGVLGILWVVLGHPS